MTFRSLSRSAVLVGLLGVPFTAQAQDERLSIHGSASLAYTKSDQLPINGITKAGTSDYRLLSLLFGYKLSDKSRVVTQLLHRKIGSSPLNAVTPDIEPVWAFYEHKFDNGFVTKVGRNPLPRGIFNEVRYVGTLLPLFRVGNAVYGETFEYIDGVVVRKPFDLGGDWKLDVAAFGGGYDLKKKVPTNNGAVVMNTRNENSYGAQVWLNTPIEGVRAGVFYDNYQSTGADVAVGSLRPRRTSSFMYSAEAVFSKVFARSELTTLMQTEQPDFTNFASYYVQAGVTPNEKLTLVAEYNDGRNIVRFGGTPTPDISVPLNQDVALGVTYKPSAQVAFKLEGHQAEGYAFDVNVPTVILPTSPSSAARLAPARTTYYMMATIAFTF